MEGFEALNKPNRKHDTIKQTEHKHLFAADFIQSKNEHKETHQGATLQKKMLLVEAVEPWN